MKQKLSFLYALPETIRYHFTGLQPNAAGYRQLASTLQPYLIPAKRSRPSKK